MYKKPKYPRGKLFYPTFLMEDALIILIFMAVLSAAVFFFPEWIISGESEVPADPFNTPPHIKPEWYFLASYQFLKLIPSEIGALVIQTVAVLVFTFLPFLDRSKETRISKRPIFLFIVVTSIIGFMGLTLWGALS